MLRVCLLSFDPPAFPCARYRILDPLERHSKEVYVASGLAPATSAGKLRLNRAVLKASDVVVIQRSFIQPTTLDATESVFELAKPVLYDTDDDLFNIPDWHGKPHHHFSAHAVESVIDRFTRITVSTPEL